MSVVSLSKIAKTMNIVLFESQQLISKLIIIINNYTEVKKGKMHFNNPIFDVILYIILNVIMQF